jgi:hypothetical protein
MHVVYDSCSEIGLARFGKYRRNCASDQGKYGLINTGGVK